MYRYLGTVRCCFVVFYIIARNLFSHLSNKKGNILKHKEFIRWNNHCSLYLLNGGWVQKWNYRNVYNSRCTKKNILWHNCCFKKMKFHINHMKHSEAIRSNEFLLLRFLLRRPKLQIIQFFSWVESKMKTANHKKVDNCLTVKDNKFCTQISFLILRVLYIFIERKGNVEMVQKGCFRSFEIMKQRSRYNVRNFKYLVFILSSVIGIILTAPIYNLSFSSSLKDKCTF